MYSPKVFIVLAAILLGIQTVYGKIACYECLSASNETCGDKFNDNKDKLQNKDCGANFDACFKVTIEDAKKKVVQRGCGAKNYCDVFSSAYLECNTCESEYCNSSLNILPSFVTITAGISVVLIKFLFS